MDRYVLSIFASGGDWIPGYVRSADHRFRSLDATYAHDRSRANASGRDWVDYLKHRLSAWRPAPRDAGFMPVFP